MPEPGLPPQVLPEDAGGYAQGLVDQQRIEDERVTAAATELEAAQGEKDRLTDAVQDRGWELRVPPGANLDVALRNSAAAADQKLAADWDGAQDNMHQKAAVHTYVKDSADTHKGRAGKIVGSNLEAFVGAAAEDAERAGVPVNIARDPATGEPLSATVRTADQDAMAEAARQAALGHALPAAATPIDSGERQLPS